MKLTRHAAPQGPRWAVDGKFAPADFSLRYLLQLPAASVATVLSATATDVDADGPLLAPIEAEQEAWAAGVTYLRSRAARMAESDSADIYDKVYDAERVEVFYKGAGRRIAGDGQAVRVRRDSDWNVPEPELCLVINAGGEIVGYSVGNDMSSRDIEGANPLYLPQAKVYDGSAAIGPAIVIADSADMRELPIAMTIRRGGETVFEGEANTGQLKRGLEEMTGWLVREHSFPYGVFLMTGTCIVPPDEFSLAAGDTVVIRVGELELTNPVES